MYFFSGITTLVCLQKMIFGRVHVYFTVKVGIAHNVHMKWSSFFAKERWNHIIQTRAEQCVCLEAREVGGGGGDNSFCG